jgi:hypothetical protein
VFDAFYRYGPAITTRGVRSGFGANRGFAELTGYALDAAGRPQSFLSTEEHYRLVRSLHQRNLIVPLSGDFAGPKTIRAIGAYLAPRGAKVSAFYVSNVEQYLFQDMKSQAFYANVAALPWTRRACSSGRTPCAAAGAVARRVAVPDRRVPPRGRRRARGQQRRRARLPAVSPAAACVSLPARRRARARRRHRAVYLSRSSLADSTPRRRVTIGRGIHPAVDARRRPHGDRHEARLAFTIAARRTRRASARATRSSTCSGSRTPDACARRTRTTSSCARCTRRS